MRRSYIAILFLAGLIFSCKNLLDADPSPRTTFLKFYEGPYSIQANSIAATPDGFVIAGSMLVPGSSNGSITTETVIISTDKKGNRVGDIVRIKGNSGKIIKAIVQNGSVSGYIVAGDSIVIDLAAEQSANVTVTSMKALLLDQNFNVVKSRTLRGDTSRTYIEDYSAESVEVVDDGFILLGTYKEGIQLQQAAPSKQLLFKLNNNFDSVRWYKEYELLNRTSQNSKSIHYSNGRIIWASSLSQIQGDINRSWVTIPVIEEESVYKNFSTLKENSDQTFIARDIKPSSIPGFGFAVTGTYSKQPDGTLNNIFFLRVDEAGSIIPGSDKYFDVIDSEANGASINSDNSSIQDQGETLTATSDGGFVLAASFDSNTTKGNGGKDLVLIKLNWAGDLVWMKTYGAQGNEVPSGILETAEGDLIVVGTNVLEEYASAFLLRTDKNGELKN
jgi:hypothetical protein